VALSQQNVRLRPYQTGDHYSLGWELDNPENFTTFHIEISEDGQIFKFYESIPAIEKKIKQIYTFKSSSRLRGKLFFRVRGIGDAGIMATSNIVHLNFDGPLLLYPNPGSNKIFISCRLQDIRQIIILDAQSKNYQIQKEDHGSLTAIKTSNLPPGFYKILLLYGEKWQGFSFVKR
jgi:hypothetical protein